MRPTAFDERMRQMLGAEAEAFFEAMAGQRTYGLRRNPLRKPVELPFEVEAVPWCPTGYYYPEDAQPGKHPLHDAGAYYIQDPSAMAVAEAADVQPGMRVLDLCAAPGGKATQLAGKLMGEGLLVANEIVPSRAKELCGNLERMGVANAIVTCERPDRLAERWEGYFDRVVVDAPCSGEGLFRREPAAMGEWTPEHVEACAQRQRLILQEAAKMVRPGGRLVYSTCTFAPQENEENAAWFLTAFPNFEPVEVSLPGWSVQGNCARFWPHKGKGEGHFLAVFHCNNNFSGKIELEPTKFQGKLDSTAKVWYDIAAADMPARLANHGDLIMALPEETPLLQGLRVVRAGLALFEVKGKVLKPHHAMVMAVPFQRTLDVSEDQAALNAYMRGETIRCTAEGWTAVTWKGLPLGLGKGVSGTLKNHRPKGLRR